MNNSTYNIVASTSQSTVVSKYIPEGKRSDGCQSEAELEREFIKQLSSLGYEYLTIHDESSLITNLRKQLEALNNYTFSNNEWKRFFETSVSNKNDSYIDKTKRIQVDYIQNLALDNGLTKNIKLIDKENIHNNRLQVINQYEENQGNHKTRYDATILVNGLPLVHIELKRRGVPIREAFNQIERYKRDSFWASSGLYEYIQIFVISNGTNTKYYSNTTRESRIREAHSKKAKSKRTSSSFEFTSFWADADNKIIPDLIDFTKTFFARHCILNILAKYCVFTAEDILLVMRPYQIAACEKILNRIVIANNYKYYGHKKAGGYIWHTTGSGKTLTSFKTAQLAKNLPFIDKVIFVVDRKDLDYQTMREYDKFQKGSVDSNTSTKILERQLNPKSDAKIIITTIQKLSRFISKYKEHEIFKKHVVIVFDECHRSQFGDMHKAVIKAFKNYYIFGFTGTPIFQVNSNTSGNMRFNTTSDIFGGEPDENGKEVLALHTYTIVDAINDENVLPFRIDYINTVKEKEGITDAQVKAIDIEKAMLSPERISRITSYILEHFNQKTNRNNGEYYDFNKLTNIKDVAASKNKIKEQREKIKTRGFNSIFAVSSIESAKLYYSEFKKQMKARPEQALNVGLIYSFGVNEDTDYDILEEENPEDTSGLDQSSRDFLDYAIKDYNKMFASDYDTSPDKFQNYYKDVSQRMKNKELDLLIVVNMFLTGFDATTLNTLWVDKNLKYHGLIQAFSRTNRILNSVKKFGNIVCFRDLEENVKQAVALFGDREASGIVLLKNYKDYYCGYTDDSGKHKKGYTELIENLKDEYPLEAVITGEKNKKNFIKLFGSILRIRNILNAFDEFIGDNTISARDLQNYQSIYLDFCNESRNKNNAEKENINDDIEFEIELVKQVEVNIDYILMLVDKYHKNNCTDKEILADIDRAVSSSTQLRSKKELIKNFIDSINPRSVIEKDWKTFVEKQKEADLSAIIKKENLNPEETGKFIENSFRNGGVKTLGTDFDKLLPPMGFFGSAGKERKTIKQRVTAELSGFFEKYFGLF